MTYFITKSEVKFFSKYKKLSCLNSKKYMLMILEITQIISLSQYLQKPFRLLMSIVPPTIPPLDSKEDLPKPASIFRFL